jgi:hypothetical protein
MREERSPHLMSNLALLTIVLRIIRNPMLTIILGIFTCGTHEHRDVAKSLLSEKSAR